MFGIDTIVWGVIAVSIISNLVVDVLVEVPLEYAANYWLAKSAGDAGEGLASAETLDVTWMQHLVDGARTASHNWEMLSEIESVGRLVAQFVL